MATEGAASPAVTVITDADRALERRSGAFRKLWRQRSVALLADLFHELCDTLTVEWLIECGAHDAEASERFVAGGEHRRAIALEANPFTYTSRTALVSGPRLTALQEGIAGAAGRMLLSIPDDGTPGPTPVMASFLTMNPANRGPTIEVPVEVTTLDLLDRRFGLTGRVALWIDVEGMSREVLEGGSRMVPDRAAVVMLEVEQVPFWDDGGSSDEVDRLMRSYGFVALARDSQQEGQFNVIYLRPEHVALAAAPVERYLSRATSPVPLGERLEHAVRSGRKQGLRRAAASALRERLVVTLGRDRAVRLKGAVNGLVTRRSGD